MYFYLLTLSPIGDILQAFHLQWNVWGGGNLARTRSLELEKSVIPVLVMRGKLGVLTACRRAVILHKPKIKTQEHTK